MSQQARTIAICAPATPLTREQASAVAELAACDYPGLNLRFHEQCFAAEGHFAGGDEVRLAALLECANDPQVDAVWFAKGGYGCARIVAGFMAGLGEAAKGKTWLGYSDCGVLLGALYARGIGTAVHAPMPIDIKREDGEAAVRRTLDWLSGGMTGVEPSGDGLPRAAFNLMTLAMLAGTRFMPDLSGHELLVEEVGEYEYAVDRLFFHVMETVPGIAALRLGEVSAVPVNDRPFGAAIEDIARYWCGRYGIEYRGRAAIGHSAANRIVPFGT